MQFKTDLAILRRALVLDQSYARGYQDYREACEQDYRAGHRPHYCEHGTNQWTDYDNICGWCESGFTASDPMQRRRWALNTARIEAAHYR